MVRGLSFVTRRTGMADAAPAPNFEDALRELETLVRALETGSAPLEESLAAFERGTALLRICQDTLTRAEQKIQVLESGRLTGFAAAEVAPES